MTPSPDLQERLRFLGIDAETQAALGAFRPQIEAALPGILKAFYVHVGQWPGLAGIFRDAASQARAEAAQGAHWRRLFAGRFDAEYAASVRRIGLTHSHVGLEPGFYIGAYAFVLARLYELACHHHASTLRPAEARRRTAALMRALNQVVMLDMDLAISAYLEENKITFARHLSELSARFEARIGPLVTTVATQTGEIRQAARSLSEMARQNAARVDSVTATAQEANGNVSSVAAAAEELAASVAGIARQMAHSTSMTSQAVATARRTDDIVRTLAQGAQKIGEVVGLIDTVAAQTNLLALNATIEAARAGEAGKGFAVVASEVKTLASQTRSATEVISQQIAEMQTATQGVVQAISEVGDAIAEIDRVAIAIAAALERQGRTTQDISRNVQEAAAGTRQMASTIEGVGAATQETGEAAATVLRAAETQGQQAEGLRQEVCDFVRQIRAA